MEIPTTSASASLPQDVTNRRGATARHWQIALVLALFAGAAFLFAWRSSGDDLSSSYIGCRVLTLGQQSHLYSFDVGAFDRVRDPVWIRLAKQTGFPSSGILHPYVQTPLWAFALEPLCSHTNYRPFLAIFLILEIASFSGLLWLVARHWAPSLFHPGWMAVLALVFYASDPVRYALIFGQTHILYILATVAALIWAQRRPVLAGGLLAFAAAVKITPAYFLLYWLLTRRWKAAVSFLACSAALVALSIAVQGWPLFHQYLAALSSVSNLLLVSYNNQSLAAAVMSHNYPAMDMITWTPHPLPHWLKLLSSALALASALAGGWIDRGSHSRAPYGAAITLIGITIFTPIAWTHYFFILIIPIALLLEEHLRRSSLPLLAVAILICVFNVTPHRAFHYRFRSRFYAGAISIAGLAAITRRNRDQLPSSE